MERKKKGVEKEGEIGRRERKERRREGNEEHIDKGKGDVIRVTRHQGVSTRRGAH